jgi:hypothetical protein
MLCRQSDRPRSTMADAAVNCVTDMFMAISNLSNQTEASMPAALTRDFAPNRGLKSLGQI